MILSLLITALPILLSVPPCINSEQPTFENGILSPDEYPEAYNYSMVAFMAELSKETSVYENSTIPFNQLLVDTSRRFSNLTGVFVCPDDGIYMFMWSVMSPITPGISGGQEQVSERKPWTSKYWWTGLVLS